MNKIILLIFIVSLAIANAVMVDPHLQEFEEFKQKYQKTYASSDDHSQRSQNYRDNKEHIMRHQMLSPSARFAHNRFSDMTPEEFEAKYLNFNYDLFIQAKGTFREKPAPIKTFLGIDQNYLEDNSDLPEFLDWREKNIITPAKYQSTCGSCWTFSTTGLLESQYALKYNELLHFSEQQLLDCD